MGDAWRLEIAGQIRSTVKPAGREGLRSTDNASEPIPTKAVTDGAAPYYYRSHWTGKGSRGTS